MIPSWIGASPVVAYTLLVTNEKSIRVGPAGEEISALRCAVTLPGGKVLDVFVQKGEEDEISRAMAAGEYAFPESYSLLPAFAGPGARVVDLGAHIGTFALYAAACGCEVVAVEASPRNAALLAESARENGLTALRVVQAAASARAGTLDFLQLGPYGLVANAGVRGETVRVPAIAVDDLAAGLGWEQIHFIKMDIEGSEPAALMGMQRLLSRDGAPPLLFESNGHTLHLFGETPGRLLSILESLGYRCYTLGAGTLAAVTAADPQLECVVDCLAVKGPLPPLGDWRLAAAPALAEQVETALRTAAHENQYVRAHLGRTLETAGAALLEDPRITAALAALGSDPEAEVRAAVAWREQS